MHASPEAPPVMTPDHPDWQRVVVEWNATETEYPSDKCVHELFEEQVARTPDATAVVQEGQTVSYRELNRRSNQIAHWLLSSGVEPEMLVGLYMRRSVDMIAAVLGVLKAGGAYVPIERSMPRERIEVLLKDSKLFCLITDNDSDTTFPSTMTRQETLVVALSDLSGEAVRNPPPHVRSGNLAYVIYTSGSTGRPKGVMIEHRGLVNYLCWCIKTYSTDGTWGAPVHTSFAFDLAVTSLFVPLLTGRSIVLADENQAIDGLMDVLLSHPDFSFIKGTPAHLSLLNNLLEREQYPSRARTLIIGGEQLYYEQTAPWSRHAPDTRIYNEYGPTETVVGSCVYLVDSVPGNVGPIPIGRPIANTQVFVLDPELRPLQIGVAGELYIGGDGVARGYLNRPELTAERFIANPFSNDPKSRLYRTGDLCRWREDGNLEYLGRLDDQVKLRGFRIELGEIESVLNEHEAVASSVVILREDRPDDKRLVAYFVPKSNRGLDLSELRSHLAKRLPVYMHPSAIVLMDSLPLTANGKIDRRMLPAPDDSRPELESDYLPPRTTIEKKIATIWAEVLRIKQVGIHDSFFRLGGNSLTAVRVLSRVNHCCQSHLVPRDLFDSPTIEGMASRISEYQHSQTGVASVEELTGQRIPRVSRSEPIPVSSAQERMWLLDQTLTNRDAYNIPLFIFFYGKCNTDALLSSLRDVLQRHESLRTRYSLIDDTPVQAIDPELALEIPIQNLCDWGPEQRASYLTEWTRSDASKPFDLEHGPLVRAKIFVVEPGWHQVYLNIHHISCDGWSINILIKEWEHCYQQRIRGKAPELPPPPLEYVDFAVHQRRQLATNRFDKGLEYWCDQLRDMPGRLDWPGRKTRTVASSQQGETLRFEIEGGLSRQIESYCESRSLTPNMVLLAAYQVLLSRHAGQSEIVTGIPIAGRNSAELEAIVGLFVNTLPIRTPVREDDAVHDLVRQVRDSVLGAMMHQEVPLDKIVAAVRPERSVSATPLFQTMFVLQNAHDSLHRWSGIEVRVDSIANGTAKFDLTLSLQSNEGSLTGDLEYATELFTADEASQMVEQYQAILRSMVENPEQRIGEIDVISPSEHHRVLVDWNATETEYPRDACVHELFEQQAERTPDSVALVQGDRIVSYGELNRRSNQIAHWLIEHGVQAGDRVGLSVERSPETIMAMIGILKAGAAYVPLDPKYPESRTRFMVEDANLQVLITDAYSRDRLAKIVETVLCLDRDSEILEHLSTSSPQVKTSAEDLAYVMYTSGSTGTPKGVEIPHRGIVRLVVGTDYTQFDATRVFLQLSSISFDAATLEVWGPLLWGAKLVLALPELPDFDQLEWLLKHHGVTTLWLTSTLFNEVVEHDPLILSRLSELLIGGEALSIKHVEMARAALGERVQIINGYGPTESTTFACCYRIPKQGKFSGSSIPIGKPIANTQVFVLDDLGRPAPIGIPGELVIGGDGLARGYWNREELTKERFVPNPFLTEFEDRSLKTSNRLYRTGDRCRWLPDGNLEFLGRIDGQIKLRGHRIETGEIESVLQSHPDVLQSAVILREDRPGDKRLVGYCTMKPGASTDSSSLASYLATRLPVYMTPSAIVILEKFPFTTNGKLDRAALHAPNVERENQESNTPTTELEKQIAAIWSEVLSVPNIGIHDNFFELGGNSLLAMRAFAKMSSLVGNTISPSILFQHGTIAELISLTHSKGDTNEIAYAIPLQSKGTGSPLFVMPQLDGELFQMRSAFLGLGEEFPVMGIQIQHRRASIEYLTDLPSIARDATHAICKKDPNGPYSLVGYSYGGFLAFEVACQLIALGKEVANVIVIDTGPGPSGLKQIWMQRFRSIPQIVRQVPHWVRSDRNRKRLSGLASTLRNRWERITGSIDVGEKDALNSDNDRHCQQGQESYNYFKQIALHAVRNYEPGYYTGTLTLIRATHRPIRGDHSRDLGWEPHVQQVDVLDIDGDHLNILKPPRIDVVTDHIKRLMQESS